MNESLRDIIETLSDPASKPRLSDVEAVTGEYPFFVVPAVVALKRMGTEMDAELRQKLMSIIALNSPDPQSMFMLADVSHEEFVNFYPVKQKEVTTDNAITKFLETYGHADPREEALLERLIFNPTPDYSSILEREQERDFPSEPSDPSDTSQDALINSFLIKHRDSEADLLPREEPEEADKIAEKVTAESETDGTTKSGYKSGPAEEATATPTHPVQPAPAPGYDSSLSESLAKIYIRQKRYDKAFEIIHTLSLNNPKKSAYFADQLRFLRKLIINRESIENSK